MPKRYVLLNDVRSLHNVGSIFRTSDGAGVDKVYLCGQTGYPPREEITKTAIGAEESVEWEYFIDAKECAEHLKEQGIKLVALEQTEESKDYKDLNLEDDLCLMLGHEIDGVNKDLIQMADHSIEIPMHGEKQSLNVSVAFGIAIYELSS